MNVNGQKGYFVDYATINGITYALSRAGAKNISCPPKRIRTGPLSKLIGRF